MTIHLLPDTQTLRKQRIIEHVLEEYDMLTARFRINSSLDSWKLLTNSMLSIQAINSGLLDQVPWFVDLLWRDTPIYGWSKTIRDMFKERNPC